RYRYREKGATEWGSWTNKTATVTGANVTTAETLLALDNETEYEFQVEIIDLFSSTVVNLNLSVGRPILFIGSNRTVGINHKPEATAPGLYLRSDDAFWDALFPVGRRFQTNDSSEDPN